jgi:hypothetical protein
MDAQRDGELLPVAYFLVVFTLPAAIGVTQRIPTFLWRNHASDSA